MSSVPRQRSLDFAFDRAWPLEISRPDAPFLVRWRLDGNGASTYDHLEIPIAVIAFEPERRRRISRPRIDDDCHGAENEGRNALVLKPRFQFQN